MSISVKVETATTLRYTVLSEAQSNVCTIRSTALPQTWESNTKTFASVTSTHKRHIFFRALLQQPPRQRHEGLLGEKVGAFFCWREEATHGEQKGLRPVWDRWGCPDDNIRPKFLAPQNKGKYTKKAESSPSHASPNENCNYIAERNISPPKSYLLV